MACSRPFSTRTSVTSGSTSCSSDSVCRSGSDAHAATRTGATSQAARTPRIAILPSLRLRLDGAVVAVGEGEASLVQIGLQPFPAQPQLLAGDGLQHVALAGHQEIETLARLGDAGALALDRDLVA